MNKTSDITPQGKQLGITYPNWVCKLSLLFVKQDGEEDLENNELLKKT